MRQIYKTTRFIISMVLTTCFGLFFLSCVREGMSECPPDSATLKVLLSHQQTDITITPEDLKRAVVYVFDEAGDIFTVWTIENPVFGVTYDTGITLGTETYRLIAWLNPDDPYSLTPAYETAVGSNVKIADARLSLNIPDDGDITEVLPDGTVTTNLPWLLFGDVDNVKKENTTEVVEIPVELDNYVITLTVKGLTPDTSTYAFEIKDNNGTYDFYNNYVSGSYFNYITSTTFSSLVGASEDILTASLITLKLDHDRSPEISFSNMTTKTTLYPTNGRSTVNLVELIKRVLPGNDFNIIHRYNIQLNFLGDMSAQVLINGWELKGDDYEIK